MSDDGGAKRVVLHVRAVNVRGAFGKVGGLETHTQRVDNFTTALGKAVVVVAVIGEPRLGPCLVWPAGSGYSFLGGRSTAPETVAVLIFDEVADVVVQIAGYGDERAIWLETLVGEKGLLLLCVYAPHRGKPENARMYFWKKRLQEFRELLATDRYRGWEVVLVGDCNLHIARLAAANARYEGGRERDITAMIEGSSGMGLSVRNPEEEAPHKSGTVIDLVTASRDLVLDIEVVRKRHPGAASDHNYVEVVVEGVGLQSQRTVQLGSSRWDAAADWGVAVCSIPKTLRFIIGWTGVAMRCDELKGWVVTSSRRGIRQVIVDLTVWWRMVALMLVGHLGKLVRISPPRSKQERLSEQSHQVEEWFPEPVQYESAEERDILVEEAFVF